MNVLLVKEAMLKTSFWDPDIEELDQENAEWEKQQQQILDAAKAQGIDISGDLAIEGSGNNWTVNGKPVRLQPTPQQKATEDLKSKVRQTMSDIETGNTAAPQKTPKVPITPAPTPATNPAKPPVQPKSTTTQSETFGPNKVKAVEGFRQL